MANKTKMTANTAIFVFVFLLLFSIPNSRANNIVDAPIPNYLAVVIKRTQKEIQRINKAFDNSKSNNTIIYKNSKSFIRNNTANKINVANKDSKKNLINTTAKNYTNTTIVNPLDLPTLTNNVNLLYKMGYLPFYAQKVDNKTGIVIWQWDTKIVPSKLALLTPKSLQSILYKSAINHFLNDMGLNSNIESRMDISSLLENEYKNHWQSSKPFVWVLINQKLPERLKVWQNGNWLIESNCNTGVDHLTPDGNFIVYVRYKYFTMNGIFPINDKPYHDPNVPYVNFFNGNNAIHGFPRHAYGYPQSAGCVELPIKIAKRLYRYLYVGTLVTIIN
ncbi:hypothetical protein DESAMIL20_1188 [Desulfurella amilsii]|uniref:L,D-TPase catalytic domain-containing protein n=1 Tax=Desulfurella amilsii TaxID=1562698 RepID=A0A1X4XVU4_9BACT|nr:L,D-transpeptidase [Desulfurella amilsii]OSS41635.1 hypothetical protein DESAMIL20_1188 [Desulfurella amilsii]